LRPYELTTTSLAYSGYKWAMAHYLSPIASQHFLITSIDGKDVTTSSIYQNPVWSTTPNPGAINLKTGLANNINWFFKRLTQFYFETASFCLKKDRII